MQRLLDWGSTTNIGPVAKARAFLRRHKTPRLAVRLALLLIRNPASALSSARKWISPPSDGQFEAIIKARSYGGGVSLAELEALWKARAWARRILLIGPPRERDQARAIFEDGGGTCFDCAGIEDARRLAADGSRFDLFVAALSSFTAEALALLTGKTPLVVNVGASSRTQRDQLALLGTPSATAVQFPEGSRRLQDKLNGGARIKVVLLNDVGFQYGAGIAMRRQAASLLALGWEVAVVAWTPGMPVERPVLTGLDDRGIWRGIYPVSDIHRDAGLSDDQIVARLIDTIQSLEPDVVITGNLHGTNWPVGIHSSLRRLGIAVVAYMHDLHWITGRCAYPMTCTLFQSGCDERCPTPDEYPRLAPDKIADAWRKKGSEFSGTDAIPLLANSQWTHDMIVQRFGSAARTAVVPLGVDHELFAPMDKVIVRRLLGLPDRKPIVAMGAVNVRDQWKGGPDFHELYRSLLARTDLEVILFGHLSEELKSLRSFGLVGDEQLMPFIYNAADIFVNVATAEAFGQTLLEAAACGVPTVAYRVGGTTTAVVHEETGILVDPPTVSNALAAIDRLLADQASRETMGRKARSRVEQNFTLLHQAQAWVSCLKNLC
jgi:glycosyltransferase involved in cell wall biosynthesis